MIVPVDVNRAAVVPVSMTMPLQHRDAAARWRIERIVSRIGVTIAVMVVSVMMVMLGKAGPVRMGMTAATERYRHVERVRLRNLLQRLPERPSPDEREDLALAGFPDRLRPHAVGHWSRQAKPGRNAVLENRKLNNAVAGIDALRFQPVAVRVFGRAKERKTMAVAVDVAAPVASDYGRARFPLRRNSRIEAIAIQPPKAIRATLAAVSMK